MTYRTRQEIFDIVARHLLTQNARSVSGLSCKYRGPEGRKCAIGALIPDEKYHLYLEGRTVYCSEVCEAAGIDPRDEKFADSLQRIHDGHPVGIWRKELAFAAFTYGVDASVLDEFKKEEVL